MIWKSSIIRATALFFSCVALVPTIARAQTPKADGLKRVPPPTPTRPACAPTPAPKAPTDAQRKQARDLAQNGRQAAILGDSAAAFAQMREASTLDPTDSDLAYDLARAYETAHAAESAAKEYCRFLSIAPNAPEAGEVRNRIAALVPAKPVTGPTVASALFNAGVVAYDSKKLDEADAKFAAAINAEPTWADSYYNHALVRSSQGDQQRALSDLEEYLRLKPQAADRAQVVARIASLRQRPPSPSEALGLGLVLPGAGQFYTRRPLRGVLYLAGTAAAIGFSLQQDVSRKSVQETGTDPFGNPYTFTTTHKITDRPYLVPGVALAGAVVVASAVEAYLFANRSAADVKRVSVSIEPAAHGLAARVSLPLP